MKLTRKGEYAILGITYIAQQEKDVIYTKEIADAWGLPESFLAKIFQCLSKKGILNSHKGVSGGFSLARPIEQITLKDILDVVQGPTTIGWCKIANVKCDRFQDCALSHVLDGVRDNMKSAFKSTTIADLSKKKMVR